MPQDRARHPSTRRRRFTRLAVAGLALALLAACTADDPATAPEAQAQQAGEQDAAELRPDLAGAAGTGEPVEQERFTVTVTSFECEEQDAGGANRCVLTLSVTNDTGTAQSIEFDRQVLLDEFGTEYAFSHEGTAAEGTRDDDIEPGEARTVALVYELPEEVLVVAVRLSDSPGDDGVLVDLLD